MKPIQKIVVLGPESTGKSTLCAALAAHYQTIWTPEYARTYLSEHGTKYTYDDLLTIAKGQIQNEDNAYKNLKFSVDKTMIENHSAIDVYIKLESKSYKIPAGSTIKIKNDKYA